MKYDKDMFAHQFPIVAQFVRQLAYYRSAKPVYDKLNLKSPFWCATIDAHLKIATIEWCNVFGVDGCNSTHWKKIASIDIDATNDLFRNHVLSEVGFSMLEWIRYHKKMCDFRNKYVAHYEMDFSQPVPDFDIALRIAYAYDKWIRDLIYPDIYEGPKLNEEFENWFRRAGPLVEKAMNASAGMEE